MKRQRVECDLKTASIEISPISVGIPFANHFSHSLILGIEASSFKRADIKTLPVEKSKSVWRFLTSRGVWIQGRIVMLGFDECAIWTGVYSSSFCGSCACWTRYECNCATVKLAWGMFLSALISRLVRELTRDPDAIWLNPGAAKYSASDFFTEVCSEGNAAPEEKQASSMNRTSPRATTIFSRKFHGMLTAPGEMEPLVSMLAIPYGLNDLWTGLTIFRVQIVRLIPHDPHRKRSGGCCSHHFSSQKCWPQPWSALWRRMQRQKEW